MRSTPNFHEKYFRSFILFIYFLLREKMERWDDLSWRLLPKRDHSDTLSARLESVEVGDPDELAPSPIEDHGEYKPKEWNYFLSAFYCEIWTWRVIQIYINNSLNESSLASGFLYISALVQHYLYQNHIKAKKGQLAQFMNSPNWPRPRNSL